MDLFIYLVSQSVTARYNFLQLLPFYNSRPHENDDFLQDRMFNNAVHKD